MKIVITGISGFVGQNLSVFLNENGNEVQGLSLRTENWFFDKKADVIIHLAGKAHDTTNTSCEEEYFNVNTDLTRKLFNQFLRSEVQDFVYFSSVKATADSIEGTLDENHISNPKTPYGKSKLEAEKYLLSQKLPVNKRLFIIRPCMIHGPGNKGNLNLLYKVVEKGIPWPLGSFTNKRSFLSVENLCFVIKELLENETIPSGIYNVSDKEALSTNELIELLGLSLGKKNRILNIPSSWIKGIATVGDHLHLPLNTERLQKLTENYVVSNKKIITAIRKPLPIESKEGLLKTFESFKSKK
jgi:nucleoside-diphosphate-sugar epimerase